METILSTDLAWDLLSCDLGNQRFFEIKASKALQLVDENQYIYENFPEDEAIIYKNNLDLFKKCEYYLENYPDYYVENSYNNVIKNHTFSSRIKYILECIYD